MLSYHIRTYKNLFGYWRLYFFWISGYLSWVSIGNLQFLHRHILMHIPFYPLLSSYSVFWSNGLSNNIQVVNLVYPILAVTVSYSNFYDYPYRSIQNLILLLLWLSMFIHKKPKISPFLSGDLFIHIRWFNLWYPLISSRFSCWVSDPVLGCSGLSRLLLNRTCSSTG